MEQPSYNQDPLVVFVRQLLPQIVVEPDKKPQPGVVQPSYHITLPAPRGADYCFTLWLGGYEKQISARLLGQQEGLYFWYMPFEEVAFRAGEELDTKFRETVENIVGHQTRIQQKTGLLFNHFSCDYESATGWKRVFRCSAARWIRAPKIDGRARFFLSPPLI